ncbi:MAG: NAD-dependent epimerase/dehydratase family protein, partial [Pseudomonadota bacterium]|nr:NAD-dependent epimerase/dehydratase family protein [Pseudomonadota bacterium]
MTKVLVTGATGFIASHTILTLINKGYEVRGTARARVHAVVDEKRGVITVTSAIDNLGKGAAGQAVHCMN